ncbi:NAD(P)-binding domain-containing protein [Chelativorans xinjiangense]|uniref:NAD(P)-binding domain-containing protein n=1 Tax=Chelativorans xinjiangense TaxID=2681485 RepID=UPI00135968D6|nr:NAD(P)-binding domain-containing protein [Chelativorans xinjiangense]
MARIGFLGTGEIASAMVQTIAGAGRDIVAPLGNERASAELQRKFPGLNQALSRALAENGTLAAIDGLQERLRLPPKEQ